MPCFSIHVLLFTPPRSKIETSRDVRRRQTFSPVLPLPLALGSSCRSSPGWQPDAPLLVLLLKAGRPVPKGMACSTCSCPFRDKRCNRRSLARTYGRRSAPSSSARCRSARKTGRAACASLSQRKDILRAATLPSPPAPSAAASPLNQPLRSLRPVFPATSQALPREERDPQEAPESMCLQWDYRQAGLTPAKALPIDRHVQPLPRLPR